MKRVTKRFVTFMCPGSFVGESYSRDVDDRFSRHDVAWPDNAYAFTLHERTDVIDGQEVFVGKPIQIGPIYYHPDSKVESLEEVRANPNAQRGCLISNMECNGWGQIIWSRWGNWPQPFDAEKMHVMEKSTTTKEGRSNG